MTARMWAFSTLGCPGLPLDEVADIAAAHGFMGVELRAADGEPVTAAMGRAARRSAARLLRERGVDPLAIASYVRVADVSVDDGDVEADATAHGQLAADLGAPFLRVFPGGPSTPAAGIDERAGRRLAAITDALRPAGVTVAIETHDSHPTGGAIRQLLDRAPGTAVIWDVLHTWRGGETPADTVDVVSDALAYVQVKDVASAADLTPLLPGRGVLPLDGVGAALRGAGYAGPVSWEYEKAWFGELPTLADSAGEVARWLGRFIA